MVPGINHCSAVLMRSLLTRFHTSGDVEKVAFRFAFGIWNQVESNKSFNIGDQGKVSSVTNFMFCIMFQRLVDEPKAYLKS